MKLLLVTLLGVIAISQGDSQLLQNFAIGNNKFTADLYKELRKSNTENFLVCTLSAETVLALIHAGAGGQTAQQLAAALHLPNNKQQIQEIIKELEPYLQGNQYYTLDSANKIYIKNGYQIKNQFKNVAVNVFNAEVQNINFKKKQQAATEINQWVERKTYNKITNLIDPHTLSPDTRSILINAMYFHGKWVNTFVKELTRKRNFYLNNRNIIQTDMMQQTEYLNYYDSSELNAQFLELPYAGNDITMTIVLPKEKNGLRSLEEYIDDIFVKPRYTSSRVKAIIPKFTIQSTIDFKPILQTLGVNDIFENSADLSDILIGQPLKINKVIQKTFIEVEEHGTTAAAATYGEANMPIRQLSKELQEIAEQELNEVPSRVQADINHIREWISQQPHLKARTDDQWLLAFLRGSKFSLQRTKERIDFYYTVKQQMPEFHSNRDPFLPEIQELLNRGAVVLLPKTANARAPRIILSRNCKLDNVNATICLKVLFMMLDILMWEDDQFVVAGLCFVEDYTNFPYNYITQFTPDLMKKLITYVRYAHPVRVREANYFSAPSAIILLYNIIKIFLPEKLNKRICFHPHQDVKTSLVTKTLPASILPKECGGEEFSWEELAASTKAKMESYRDWFLEDAQYATDESKRPGKPATVESPYGAEGSFIKLEID